MITRLPESSGNVVGFLVRGQLTDDDYRTTLIPAIEDVTASGKKIRILFRMDQFAGWTAQGAWDDFINWPKFMSVERMAIVVDENWHEFISWLFSVFAQITHIELKFFRKDQLTDAWVWLRAPAG